MNKRISKLILAITFILTSVFILFPSMACADKGDFYKENKDFFEGNEDKDKRISDSYKEVLKNFSEEGRTLECGKFQVTCHIYKFLYDTGVSAMEFVKDIMKTTIISPTDITGNSTYKEYKNGVFAISKIALAIFIAFNMTKIVSLRMASSEMDDGGIVMNEKLISILVIGIFLFLYDKIIDWILVFQQALMTEIIDEIPSEDMIGNVAINLLMGPGLFSIVAILIIGIILVVLTLQLFYRIAFVAILYIAGPIAIATKMNDTYNFFDFWLKQFITSFLTLALQLIAIAVGLERLFSIPEYYGDTSNLFTGVAFLVLAITLPSILGQWGFSTGSARSLMSGAKTVARATLRR